MKILDLKAINHIIKQAKESQQFKIIADNRFWEICKYCKQPKGAHFKGGCKEFNGIGKKFESDMELTKISIAIYVLYGGYIP